jgi:hypothetical protein
VFFSSCLLPDNFWTIHNFTVGLPVMILGSLLLIASAVSLVHKAQGNRSVNQYLADPFDKAIYFYSLGLVSMYTFIINIALTPFRCYQQSDGSMTLLPASHLDCYDSQWKQNWFSITVGILSPLLFHQNSLDV